MKLKTQTYTDKEIGLTSQQIKTAKKNVVDSSVSKTYSQILKENVFTFFNGVNIVLAVLVIITGSYRNMLFMLVVILNTVVGFVQEARSKRVLDKLALLHQKQIEVLRDSKSVFISVEEVVQNDILIIKSGDQLPCDCILVEGRVELNESMLTGESDAIEKKIEDTLLSGSIVVSGKAKAQAIVVGKDTYVHSILKDAKRHKRYPSQLRDSIQSIIRFSTIVLVPAGILLYIKQRYFGMSTMNDAILSTVAAVVGMIPEGLVLLTSVALSAGVIKLTKKQVLVQELYCIETLARVDTLCLDKTGTITEGKMKVIGIDCLLDYDEENVKRILANMFSSLSDDNATARAVREYTKDFIGEQIADEVVPFSSTRKASSATFGDDQYIVGAYSFVVQTPSDEIVQKLNEYANKGYRSIVLAKAKKDEPILGNHQVIALILIQDTLRSDAKETLNYFKKQDVDIKIISGDDPKTVAALAKEAGVEGKSIDMSNVLDLEQAVQNYSIFGRVTPEQKKEMVIALKKQGHTVAMTGDGVNDVMALKEADCSIAMASGTEATKNIASLVLLDNKFASLPSILHEGRCVINNIQRTASLFLVKTLFSLGLSLLTLVWLVEYPFQPIQLTMISALATGIPSFVLTLEPNASRVEGNFLINVFSRALPGAFCVIISVSLTYALIPVLSINGDQFNTICTVVAGFNSLCVLVGACIPMTKLRQVLVILMLAMFGVAITLFHSFFYIVPLSLVQCGYIAICVVCIPFIQRALNIWTKRKILNKYCERNKKNPEA